MNFGMIILNQSIRRIQNYPTWIQIVLLFILTLKVFMKRFDTSNYEVNRPLPKGNKRKLLD